MDLPRFDDAKTMLPVLGLRTRRGDDIVSWEQKKKNYVWQKKAINMQSQNSKAAPNDLQYPQFVTDVIKSNPQIIVSTPPIIPRTPQTFHAPLSTEVDHDPQNVKNALNTLKSRQ
jgi:hypothetical protein